MKQAQIIRSTLLLGLIWTGLISTGHSVSFTHSASQLTLAKKTFNAALLCAQNNRQNKKQAHQCIKQHAAMRSKTRQNKLVSWLSRIQLININHCSTSELQSAKKHSLYVTQTPQLLFCVHYFQKPFQKAAVVTIGQSDTTSNWKITSVKEL
jgi:hypothetical protein